MKRKATIIALMLAFVMSIGAFTSVFAATGLATDETKAAIKESKIHTSAKIGIDQDQAVASEVNAETFTYNFYKEVKTGKYKLISTSQLKKQLGKVVLIDTMPEGWYNGRHIPGAICQVVGAMNGPDFKILPAEKKALLKAAIKATGAKKVTKWYNKKTKKWTTKKPAKKYRGKSKKVWINKDKKIVVYCGFVGCARSHQGAMYLRSQGFTNVYRYAGGIAAWVDAGLPIEGTDIK